MKRRKLKKKRILKLGLVFLILGSMLYLLNQTNFINKSIHSLPFLTKEQSTNSGPIIVLDPGHGGLDSGSYNDNAKEQYYEKYINFQIASKVKKLLEKEGFQVYFTRTKDYDVDRKKRIQIAEKKKATIFVSIHQNSFEEEDAHGIETWYDATANEASKALAKSIQENTVSTTQAADRGIRVATKLLELQSTTIPSCLIETGFLSNPKEFLKITSESYQTQIALGIQKGIVSFLNNN